MHGRGLRLRALTHVIRVLSPGAICMWAPHLRGARPPPNFFYFHFKGYAYSSQGIGILQLRAEVDPMTGYQKDLFRHGHHREAMVAVVER